MDIARMAATFGSRSSRARWKGYGGARRLFMALLAAALCATLIPGQAGAAQSKMSGLADTVTAQAAAVTAEVQSTGCASGPRFDRFIKAMLLVSSSNGWSFQSVCNSTVDYRDGQAREGAILVRFRDRQHRLRYVGWYDSRLDQKGRNVFARLFLNGFGDPTGLVGVAGEGCPFGDECWYMRLAGEAPFMKGLAEAHDAFIEWSQTAWASVGHNPFYLAVTIPPFLVPGCASSPGAPPQELLSPGRTRSGSCSA